MMNMLIKVWIDSQEVGELGHEADYNLYSFNYAAAWIQWGFPLCADLPLIRPTETSNEWHSAQVRNFFQNLLPEGKALDDAVSTYNISKSNLAGLLRALGRESAGALVFTSELATPNARDERPPRPLSSSEVSSRIRNRPDLPFTVWDGRVRLSIAGYQDKLAVLEVGGEWYLPETARHSSTHILKPEPVNKYLAGMTTNELMCMILAKLVGVRVAEVKLMHIPEPVLVMQRFDRIVPAGFTADTADGNQVQRLQCIDGCQALGLPVDFKYERPYGGENDVKDIRDGASLKRFFVLLDDRELMQSTGPAKLEFLRWVVFQVLIGNTDAHAKNLSFFSGASRLVLAPAYDLVSGLALVEADIADSLAMAVGDNFDPRTVRAYDWALMAHECGISPRLLVNVLKDVANRCLKHLDAVRRQVREQGGDSRMMELVSTVVRGQCETALTCAGEIMSIGADNF